MKRKRKRTTESKQLGLTERQKRVILQHFIEEATQLRDALYDACADLGDEQWIRASSALAWISLRAQHLAADCISIAERARKVKP